MNDCVFCNIINGGIPSKKVYENDKVLAFHDISPNAPVHVLVVPKVHIKNITELNADNLSIIGDIVLGINEVVRIMNLSEDGFRVITNCGKFGGQTVEHLHFHILGGKQLPLNMG